LVPFGQGISGEEICLALDNQKQELLLAARAILFSDWLLLKKSSPLKLLG
jgi:hypothetical protein